MRQVMPEFQCSLVRDWDATPRLPEGIGLVEIDIGEKGLETAKHPRWDRPYRGAGVQHRFISEIRRLSISDGGQKFKNQIKACKTSSRKLTTVTVHWRHQSDSGAGGKKVKVRAWRGVARRAGEFLVQDRAHRLRTSRWHPCGYKEHKWQCEGTKKARHVLLPACGDVAAASPECDSFEVCCHQCGLSEGCLAPIQCNVKDIVGWQ
jgi:hypothetical protein